MTRRWRIELDVDAPAPFIADILDLVHQRVEDCDEATLLSAHFDQVPARLFAPTEPPYAGEPLDEEELGGLGAVHRGVER